MLDATIEEHAAIAHDWLEALEQAAHGKRPLAPLFLADSYWRDVLALSWKIETHRGAGALEAALGQARVRDVRIDPDRRPPQSAMRAGADVLEAFFRFETDTGACEGLVRLRPDPTDGGRMKAWTLMTALDQIHGHEERAERNRPTGQSDSRDFRGPNWLDHRAEAARYDDRDPAVIVVGGGQAGLAIAARLGALGVDTLIVDREARIGDNWRNRYHALTLHNQVQVNHLPYMPFPPTWPTYIPKDKLANWFEAYVEAMELNFWTGTEFLGGSYDAAAGHWNVTIRRDGAEREMHPRHVVMATGVSGIPNRPDLPGLDDFAGPVLHSSAYSDGDDHAGKRAIVVGTGNSGHDIAQDLWSAGAKVTLVQRSPTLVVNIEPSAQIPYALYNEGPTLEECDLIVLATPVPLIRQTHIEITKHCRELDRPVLEGLEARGFRLDFGDDGSGWQFKYLTRGGGYYFNVGCSDLIAEGAIDLVQFDAIDRFDAAGARMKDGSAIPADLIILSTGYKGQEFLVDKLFGKATADRVGPIWGFGGSDELRNMYCVTGQPGLYFIAGSLAQCRINSKYLALQIKGLEEGLLGG